MLSIQLNRAALAAKILKVRNKGEKEHGAKNRGQPWKLNSDIQESGLNDACETYIK